MASNQESRHIVAVLVNKRIFSAPMSLHETPPYYILMETWGNPASQERLPPEDINPMVFVQGVVDLIHNMEVGLRIHQCKRSSLETFAAQGVDDWLAKQPHKPPLTLGIGSTSWLKTFVRCWVRGDTPEMVASRNAMLSEVERGDSGTVIWVDSARGFTVQRGQLMRMRASVLASRGLSER